jgi:tRNA pseudouridine55 synthase
MKSAGDELAESGIILIDKPDEWTSHDVVNCIRRRFHIRKVGHCGTLDPIATGLLVIVCGKATKLSSRLTTQDKVYEGSLTLGIETHSQDRTGDVTAEHDPSGVTEEQVREVFAKYVGDLEQIPPMVSAIKKDGKALYRLARKGEEVEREPRAITIHSFEILEVDLPHVSFRVHCSKGTYVRTLCADIGRDLGCGAHMRDLRRLASGAFSIENAYTIDQIKSWEREEFLEKMTPLGVVLTSMAERLRAE